MADETKGSDQPQTNAESSSGWGIRAPRDTANHDWDRPPAPLPPPLPALMHAPAPFMEGQPLPPPPPPSTTPHRPAPTTAPATPRKPRNPLVIVGAGVIAIAIVAAGALAVMNKGPETVVPLSTPVPSTVAVVHAGPAELALESLTGGGTGQTLKLPGAPEAIVTTPDRSKAFLLDGDHGDVIPVNLVSGHVGAPIPVGKLPTDEELSADGSTLYVTDNLGGTVIPINTSTDKVASAQALSQGVDFYVPSPTTSGALVGVDTSNGQPGVVYFYDPASGKGSPVSVGANPVDAAFYSKDGNTVWVVEQGSNGQPGVLIPIEVATQKPGTSIKLGVAPSANAMTPNGQTAVFTNQNDNTVTIVNLVTRAVVATIAVGTTPTAVDIDAAGTTAWVACGLSHTLVPINLVTNKAGAPVSLQNVPGALALPAKSGAAWVLFPSSNGNVTFVGGTVGPIGRAIPVGNDPNVLLGTGSESSWVANSLNDTVQRLNVAGQTSGPAIPVARAPNQLSLTPDGSALLVLSYEDGVHAGMLTKINTSTSKPKTGLSVGPAPGPMVVSTSGALAFVASYLARTVTVIDIVNWRVSGTYPLPCGPTDIAVMPDESQLFVACGDSSAVLGYALPGLTLKAIVPVAGIRGLVMPQQGENLLVVCDNALENIDTNSDKVVKAVTETGNLVDVVETTDASTILAIDNSGAALLWIDPVTLATVKSIAVGTRPGQVALSPDDTRAYVLDTSEQKLYVVNVSLWKMSATLSVSPDATGVAVPSPVFVPPS
jgi:YVTN family beta-propeller protein